MSWGTVTIPQPHLPCVDVDALFAETEGRTGIKREAVAEMQGISLSQLSQQLHGNGHPSLRRLLTMWFHPDPDGRRFVLTLFQVTSERLGFSELDPAAEMLGNVLTSLGSLVQHMQLRMARADDRRDDRHQRRSA